MKLTTLCFLVCVLYLGQYVYHMHESKNVSIVCISIPLIELPLYQPKIIN